MRRNLHRRKPRDPHLRSRPKSEPGRPRPDPPVPIFSISCPFEKSSPQKSSDFSKIGTKRTPFGPIYERLTFPTPFPPPPVIRGRVGEGVFLPGAHSHAQRTHHPRPQFTTPHRPRPLQSPRRPLHPRGHRPGLHHARHFPHRRRRRRKHLPKNPLRVARARPPFLPRPNPLETRPCLHRAHPTPHDVRPRHHQHPLRPKTRRPPHRHDDAPKTRRPLRPTHRPHPHRSRHRSNPNPNRNHRAPK